MSKKLKRTLIVVDLILTLIVLYVAFNWTHIKNFPKIISSYYAKEFCSCHYVAGNTEEFCHDYVRQWVPISKFSLDKDKKSVTVTGLFNTHTVVYDSERYGCRFE